MKWKGGGVNEKVQAAKEKKAQQEAIRAAQRAEILEKKEEEVWKLGARDTSKQKALEQRKIEKDQHKASLNNLFAKEQEELDKKYSKPIQKIPSKLRLSEADKFSLGKKNIPMPRLEIKKTTLLDDNNDIEQSISPKKSSPMFLSNPVYSASNLDDALFLLDTPRSSPGSSNSTNLVDRHPERRVKAAFAVYKEIELPKLRTENPSLRHSQLMEMLNKNWKKSSQNPLNQDYLPFDATSQEQAEFVKNKINRKLENMKM